MKVKDKGYVISLGTDKKDLKCEPSLIDLVANIGDDLNLDCACPGSPFSIVFQDQRPGTAPPLYLRSQLSEEAIAAAMENNKNQGNRAWKKGK